MGHIWHLFLKFAKTTIYFYIYMLFDVRLVGLNRKIVFKELDFCVMTINLKFASFFIGVNGERAFEKKFL